MAPEPENNRRLEFGHVLFIDIVGYSKLLIEEQKERLPQLTAIVLGTPQVAKSTDEQLARLPTGDGMALVFPKSCAATDASRNSSPRLHQERWLQSGKRKSLQLLRESIAILLYGCDRWPCENHARFA